MTTDEAYVMIMGEQVSWDERRMQTADLKFYEKNPRVLSKLTQAGMLDGTSEDRQEIIKREMSKESSVQTLLRTIRQHGGITEPLIVQIKTNEVLEGNSRLAALRILYEREQDTRYLNAPCRLFDLREDQIDAFLYQRHDEGQTKWSAYAKAYATYHRIIKDGVPIDEYAERTSLTDNEIKKRISIIELMAKQKAEGKTEQFSFYEQIVGSRKLNRAFEDNPGLRDWLLHNIKSGPPFLATEMRDDIPKIANKPRLLRRLMEGRIDFVEAKVQSVVSKPGQYIAKVLDNLRAIDDLSSLDKNETNAFKIQVKKCLKEIKRIQDISERK